MPWRIACLLTLVIALDRATKLFFMQSAPRGLSLFSSIISITRHRNFGIIANVPVPLLLVLGFTCIALIFLLLLLFQAYRAKHTEECYAIALLIGGAIGNFWDRVQWGFVFDWILLFHISVVNIADICIGVGLFWLLRRKRLFASAASLLDSLFFMP